MSGITDMMKLNEHTRMVYEKRLESQDRTKAVSETDDIEKRTVTSPAATPQKPLKDEYIPEEEPVPTGLYQLSHDEDGRRKIVFDNPEKVSGKPEPAPASNKKAADAPEKAGRDSRRTETCKGNTDQVDAEIRKLKQKRAKLEQQIAQAKDNPEQQAKLQAQLEQVKNELRVKDTDSYRRQHSELTIS